MNRIVRGKARQYDGGTGVEASVVEKMRGVGERCASSKLKADQVLEVRRRLAAGESQCALAREFHVHQVAIWKIHHRKTWKHLAALTVQTQAALHKR